MLRNRFLLLFSLLSLVSLKISAQKADSLIITKLNNTIHPIEYLKGDSDFRDISFLKETLKDKDLIALGEVTHGTAEVFDYKDRLIRYLVSNLGYKAIAFESDFLAMENINSYILGKVDTIHYVSGTAVLMSNGPLIKWLRSYNLIKPDKDKVQVFGVESRGYTNIINKLIAVIPQLDNADKDLMQSYLAKPFNSRVTKDELNEFKAILAKLQNMQLSDANTQYVQMLGQLISHNNNRAIRDAYMANNVIWIKERVQNNKLILWAHNGHLVKEVVYNNSLTMGSHLAKKYGSRYYVIGTDFNSGTAYVNVFVAKNRPLKGFQPYYYAAVDSNKWYEYYFNQCRYPNFIIDLNSASQDDTLNEFLTQPHLMRSIGAWNTPVSTKLSMARNFDLIVYFDKAKSM
jgi:erythromycin esterase